MRHLSVAALLVLAGMSPALASEHAPASPASPASPACKVDVLGSLGWLFERGNSDEPVIAAGQPCDRADLAGAHAHGDLRVHVPVDGPPLTERGELLDALLAHPATRCAYFFRLGAATRRATNRLAGNPDYRFSGLQAGWIGFGWGGARRDGWTPVASFGRAFVPAGGNSRAIEGFYRGRVRSECGVGRQVAQYATQAELYGPAGFDREFAAGEIVIGRFRQLHDSDSILLGRRAGAFVRDGRARKASAQGRQAFVGLPGFIVHVLPRDRLDDINNQAQNFVIVDVDAAAADALRRHGGFAHYNAEARRLWQLAATLPGDAVRFHERLLVERDAGLRARLPASAAATLTEIDRLLADPFFTGVDIYVHPRGIRPVGYHFVRMLDRNPRTPYRIELALHNLHTTLYQRYLTHRLTACESRRRGD